MNESEGLYCGDIDNLILRYQSALGYDKIYLNSHAVNDMRRDLETQIEKKLKRKIF